MAFDRILGYFDVKCGTDYSLKTISIGSSGGDLPFESLGGRFDKLRAGYRLSETVHAAFGI